MKNLTFLMLLIIATFSISSAHVFSNMKNPFSGSRTNNDVCGVCLVISQLGELHLATNQTYTNLEKYLDKICNIFPPEYVATCDNIINNNLPNLIEMLVNKYTPSVICQDLKLCNSFSKPNNFLGQNRIKNLLI